MLTPQSVEDLTCTLRATGFHVGQPSLKALDGLDAIEKLLIGFGILNDDFSPSVDRQHQRVAGFLETIEELR